MRIISLSEREAKFVNDGFDNKIDDDYGSDDNEIEDDNFRQDKQPAKSWRFGQGNWIVQFQSTLINFRKYLMATINSYAPNFMDSL